MSYPVSLINFILDKTVARNWWDNKASKIDPVIFKAAQKKKKEDIKSSKSHPKEVFRYFRSEEYAEDFVKGNILISTLKTCREYEDPLQGDSEEGFERYTPGACISGGSNDSDFVAMAGNTGIRIGAGCQDVVINNAHRETSLHDAYVLCTTIGFSSSQLVDTFGSYCVKIKNLDAFQLAITKALLEISPVDAYFRGGITYKERSYQGMEAPPGVIGFVKPPDKYAVQREYRFMWTVPHNHLIDKVVINCPGIKDFVKRVR